MKLRELWVSYGFTEDQPQFVRTYKPSTLFGGLDNWFKVREVVPLDWVKIWDHFPIWVSPDDRKRLQDLVEKQLIGEE